MFDLINVIDTVLSPIATVHQLSQRIQPYTQLAWQVMTDKKTQRILRAFGLAVLIMATIVCLGMLKTFRIAWHEAATTMQSQLESATAPAIKSQPATESQLSPVLIKPEPALEKIGVRALRKIATQQGIRNAARMRKAELLARLTATEGAIALGR